MSHPLDAPGPGPAPGPAPAPVAVLLLTAALLGSVFGCSGMPPPMLRGTAPQSVSIPADRSDPLATQCRQIREQIRANQELEREAPTTTISSDIAAAAQGKADLRIDALRSRYSELGCPSNPEAQTQRSRMTPLPPAPGVSNP